MSKKKKFKIIMILGAFAVIALVSFFYPQYAENVARAFMLLIGLL